MLVISTLEEYLDSRIRIGIDQFKFFSLDFTASYRWDVRLEVDFSSEHRAIEQDFHVKRNFACNKRVSKNLILKGWQERIEVS